MGEDNNLEMDLFNSDFELELNSIEENTTDVDEVTDVDENNNGNSGEDAISPEGVAENSDDQEDEGNEDNNSSPNPNLYSSVAALLHEQGLFPSLDLTKDKIETLDDFVKSFNSELENKVKDTLVSKIGEDGYNALQKGISLLELNQYNQQQSLLNDIKESEIQDNTELAKQIVYQDYINQGLSEEKSLKLLQRLVESGDELLIKDAKESLESIKEFNKKEFERKQTESNQKLIDAEKNKEIHTQKLKDSIYNTTSLINGQEFNKDFQNKVYKSMTQVIGKDQNGRPENKLMNYRRENPIEFDTKLYYLFELTNGFKDFSKFTTVSQSQAVKDLERVIRSNSFSQSTSNDPDYLTDANSYQGIEGDELVF